MILHRCTIFDNSKKKYYAFSDTSAFNQMIQ